MPSNFCAEQVVRHLVGETGVGAHIHMQAIGGELHAIEAAAVSTDLLEGASRAYPKRPVVFRAKRVPLTKVAPDGPISYLQLISGST